MVRGVIVDVTDPEPTPTKFGTKDTFHIVIESEIENPERPGERFCVWSPRMTPSFNEKATLRKFLKDAFGRDVVETDCDKSGNLDIEALCLGHSVQMAIKHETHDEKTFANIALLMPDTSETRLQPSGTFKRKKDREPRDNAGNGQQQPDKPATKPGTAKAHYGTAQPSWRNAIIPSGPNAGKQLQDLDAQALPVFVSKFIDWQATQERMSPESEALYLACLEARSFLDKADPNSSIPF